MLTKTVLLFYYILKDTEALQITFDPAKVSYRQLLEFFYKMHDPTTANRQGPDVGTQYRSGIYYHDEDQARIARDVTERVQKEWWKDGKVSTEIAPVAEWWDAEAYHQKYLDLVGRSFSSCVLKTGIGGLTLVCSCYWCC